MAPPRESGLILEPNKGVRFALPRAVLVTIPYSHFCELARWALEATGIEFYELKCPVGVHVPIVGLLSFVHGAPSVPGAQAMPPADEFEGAQARGYF